MAQLSVSGQAPVDKTHDSLVQLQDSGPVQPDESHDSLVQVSVSGQAPVEKTHDSLSCTTVTEELTALQKSRVDHQKQTEAGHHGKGHGGGKGGNFSHGNCRHGGEESGHSSGQENRTRKYSIAIHFYRYPSHFLFLIFKPSIKAKDFLKLEVIMAKKSLKKSVDLYMVLFQYSFYYLEFLLFRMIIFSIIHFYWLL